MTSHHCPDEECQKKMEEVYLNMKTNAKFFNVTRLIWGTCGFAILCSFAWMWSDWRAMSTTYANVNTTIRIETESIYRDTEIKLIQTEANKDIQYMKQGIDEIKVLLKQMNHRGK